MFLNEDYQYVKKNIFEISAYKGGRQIPVIIGNSDLDFVLYDPERPVFNSTFSLSISPEKADPLPGGEKTEKEETKPDDQGLIKEEEVEQFFK